MSIWVAKQTHARTLRVPQVAKARFFYRVEEVMLDFVAASGRDQIPTVEDLEFSLVETCVAVSSVCCWWCTVMARCAVFVHDDGVRWSWCLSLHAYACGPSFVNR